MCRPKLGILTAEIPVANVRTAFSNKLSAFCPHVVIISLFKYTGLRLSWTILFFWILSLVLIFKWVRYFGNSRLPKPRTKLKMKTMGKVQTKKIFRRVFCYLFSKEWCLLLFFCNGEGICSFLREELNYWIQFSLQRIEANFDVLLSAPKVMQN